MTSLAALRALEQAASPGPWWSEFFDGSPRGWHVRSDQLETLADFGDDPTGEADAALIVAARNALPGLLDRVAAAEAEREQLARDLGLLHLALADAEAERDEAKHAAGEFASALKVADETAATLDTRLDRAVAERDALRTAAIQARRDLWWFIETYGKESGEPEDDEIVARAMAIQDDVLWKALAVLAAPVSPSPAAGGDA